MFGELSVLHYCWSVVCKVRLSGKEAGVCQEHITKGLSLLFRFFRATFVREDCIKSLHIHTQSKRPEDSIGFLRALRKLLNNSSHEQTRYSKSCSLSGDLRNPNNCQTTSKRAKYVMNIFSA